MVKINNPEDSREILAEKRIGGKNNTDPRFPRGSAFVEEHTGSATMVNVDGRWDFDHPVYQGEDPGSAGE